MSRMRVAAGFCALVLSAAACGDFTSSGDPLNEAEAAELAEAVAADGFAGFAGVAAPAQSPAGQDEAAARITLTLNETGPCENDVGTATIAGSVTANFDDQAETGTVEFNYTLTPNGCQVVTEAAKVFTLDGDPNVKVEGTFNWTPTSIDGSLAYDGKIKWEEGTRAGACGVKLDVTYEFSSQGTTISGSASVAGQVCGVSINRTIEVQDVA